MQLHELLPRPIKKVKKQKSTRLSKLQKRAENVDLTLYGKIHGYYEIVEHNQFGYSGSLYILNQLKEVSNDIFKRY